jgi:hypothetical protein
MRVPRAYHTEAAVVTGGGAEVFIGTYNGKSLILPAGWHLMPPDPGELIAAYLGREIYGHRLVQDMLALGASGDLKLPSLNGTRPADRTFEWWQKTYPVLDAHSARNKTWQEARGYDLKLLVWRLVVDLLDRFRAGDPVAVGRRIDTPEGLVEQVPSGLWGNPDMVWHPSLGVLRPEQRPGQPAPGPLLRSYVNLTLMPAAGAPETKPPKKPRLPYSELLQWWKAEYLPLHPEPDKRPSREKQRQDAATRFPQHARPSEAVMQRLRSDKATPPEWTETGRKPAQEVE